MLDSPVEAGLTADSLTIHGANCLERAAGLRTRLRSLAADPNAALDWPSTFGALDAIVEAVISISGIAGLMAVVHPDKPVRDAAEAWDPKITTFFTEFYLDAELASLFERAAAALTGVSEAEWIFIEDTLREFRRNGLKLPPEGQRRLTEINEELTKLGQEFERNLATTTLWLDVSPSALEGLPQNYVASHPPAEGKVRITTNTADYVPFMKYSKDRTAARELYVVSKNRCKEMNLPLLDRLIALRVEKATLLGYPTWADYVLEPRMAKDAKTVASFIQDLRDGIRPGVASDLSIMREAAGLPAEAPVSIADAAYFEELACKTRFALDSQKLSEYFEFETTLQGFMTVAKRLFGITFEPVDAQTWHPDVRPHDITDADGTVLGRIYLDMHPRDDKYKHAAEFPIRTTHRSPDGTRVTPVCALVCNFAKPGAQPSLLTHGEVTTLFHEFGHALHEILSKADLVSQGGTKVAWDFVETPSQLLEEFAWSRESLDLFAKHYETGEPLPQDLFDAMTRARQFGEATACAQQLFYAALDQKYHTREPGFDTTAVMEQLFNDYLPFEFIPGTHFQGTFGHLVNYDAGYYGYQWALAIATDLLTRFKSDGMLNADTARAYRTKILEPGGSRDEMAMVEDFLGRKTNLEAYKIFLGVA